MSPIWAPQSEEPPQDRVSPARKRIPELLADAPTENGRRWSELDSLLDRLQHLGFSTPISEWAVIHCVQEGSLVLKLKPINKQTSLSPATVSIKKTLQNTVIVEATETLWANWKNASENEETQPPSSQRSTKQAEVWDLAIFIALAEEFRVFKEVIGESKLNALPKDNTGEQYYSFTYQTDKRTWKCVTTFGGQMGESRASRVTDRLLSRFRPRHLAVLGIAGALSKDLHLCDVVVATGVDSYLESAKSVPSSPTGSLKRSILARLLGRQQLANDESFTFDLSGEVYRTSHSHLVAISHLEFANSDQFKKWVSTCTSERHEKLESVLSSDSLLTSTGPKILSGSVASGPAVAAATAFTSFLLARNRKYMAVEMESGGVLASAHERTANPSTLVVRGISDFADERKSQMDGASKGVYRHLAMHHAVGLLWCLLDSEGVETGSTSNVAPDLTDQNELANPPFNIDGCENTPIVLRADSIFDVIDALQDHFSFRWEPGAIPTASLKQPLVYWPVRLRHPTPIHAVQTFAAAALSKRGARVVLCLDDLGNVEHNITDFSTTIARWWKRCDGTDQFEVKTFAELISEAESRNENPWPTARQWLGSTNRKVDDVLRLSKVLPASEDSSAILQALSARRPRRLLNPPVVWACMKYVSRDAASEEIITLGGHDERDLWDAWRSEMADPALKVGHLYIPTLGDTPVHMASVPLKWASKSDILESLEEEYSNDSSNWLSAHRMVPWVLNGCIGLPEFVQSDCTQANVLNVMPDTQVDTFLKNLATALDNRLMK